MSETPKIHAFDDGGDWADACASMIAKELAAGVSGFGQAAFAASGGSTPVPIYKRLSGFDIDWSRISVTLIDERYVPETSQDSNARLIKQTLLQGPASAARFIPLYSPEVTVDRAAIVATRALKDILFLNVVLLGMGEDGHICSMFPHSPTLKTLLTPTLPPAVLGVPPGRDGLAPSMERLSINLPWLIGAELVVLAITGKQKRAVFERDAAGDPAVTPIAALIAAKVPLEVLWTEAA